MKPFLLLQHRYLDEASENEYEAIQQHGELSPRQIRRVRLDNEALGTMDLGDFSGVILGGGPSNVSDDPNSKKPEQLRFEEELTQLYDQIFEADFPFLGMCYGMGSVAKYLGAPVSKEKYSEQVGAATIALNPQESDPILVDIPENFIALVGHKESCQELPDGCVLLASSVSCPFHMIRYKANIYATQFHPELDVDGIIFRIKAYRRHGYFKPEDAERLIAIALKQEVIAPQKILKNFVNRFRT